MSKRATPKAKSSSTCRAGPPFPVTDLRSLADWIQPGAVKVTDLGCGTGSLSILLAEAGLEVIVFDVSAAMLEHGRAKACWSNNSTLWGKTVADERYAIVAHHQRITY